MPDQWRHVVARAFILAGEPGATVLVHIQMPGRQLAELVRHDMLFDQRTARRIGDHQGGFHAIEVELGAAEIRMGLDPAIGDDQQAAVVADRHVVRADAMGFELADPAETIRGVIDADHAAIGVEIVFAGIEQPAVRRKVPVAEEVPVGRRGDHDRFAASACVEDDRKGTGTSGEGDREACRRAVAEAVNAVRQIDPVDEGAVLGDQADTESSVRRAEAGGKDRIAALEREERTRRKRGEEQSPRRLDEGSPVDQRRSPHLSLRRRRRNRRQGRSRRHSRC
jgi:hypothetical protein